jgi:hypothetical protein
VLLSVFYSFLFSWWCCAYNTCGGDGGSISCLGVRSDDGRPENKTMPRYANANLTGFFVPRIQ